jgi:DNA-binding XRE family transcriptional regulator
MYVPRRPGFEQGAEAIAMPRQLTREVPSGSTGMTMPFRAIRPARSSAIGDRPPAAFGATLRRCRIEAGLTQEELANRSGLSIRAISDLERNRTTKPLMRSARMLADALTLSGADRDEFADAAIASGTEQPADGTAPAGACGCPRLTAAGRVPPWPVVPRQLPAFTRQFAGRPGELAVLSGLLDEACGRAWPMPIVAIGGIAGAGKTALAVRWAAEVADRFPDGQLYVDLGGFGAAGGQSPAAEVLDGFLHALAVSPGRRPFLVADKAAMFRSIVAGRRMLILFDNARHAGHVRPLLPGSGSCLTLVTSRGELAGLAATHGAMVISLNMLDPESAQEYLASRLGTGRITAEAQAARELIGLCAGLPLALSIVAAQAAARPGTPLGALAATLRGRADGLDAWDTGDPACDLRSAISWSYDCLDEQAARMFRLLGLHPGPEISGDAAAGLAAVDPGEARRLCDQLIRVGLLRQSGAHSYALHPVLRACAAGMADAARGRPTWGPAA